LTGRAEQRYPNGDVFRGNFTNGIRTGVGEFKVTSNRILMLIVNRINYLMTSSESLFWLKWLNEFAFDGLEEVVGEIFVCAFRGRN
jgi:hypothetical protein